MELMRKAADQGDAEMARKVWCYSMEEMQEFTLAQVELELSFRLDIYYHDFYWQRAD